MTIPSSPPAGGDDATADEAFARSFKRFLDRVNGMAPEQARRRTPFGDVVSEHLGADAASLPVVIEEISSFRLVDADIALEELGARGEHRLLGVKGGLMHAHAGFAELISSPHSRFEPGPPDYAHKATGPSSRRQVVSFGARLFTYDGEPVAVLQLAARADMGRVSAQLEVLAASGGLVTRLLAEVRELMVERSVLRGKVLTFDSSEYRQDAGASFLERPNVAEADVILPDGVLESVVSHVVEIGAQRQVLRAAGQHLKRGVLLYGPPGTGKTLTVRHLLSRTDGVTAVLLTGSSIRNVRAAADLARTLQPSIVVLEDIDLVAMERSASPQPLLFEVLDALDGLDGDADVAFVMTTNRVQVLERALVSRPGRVDLAVEIPLPGPLERHRLLQKYAAGLPFSDGVIAVAAERATQTTGSFAKELVRRAVLSAARAGGAPDDGVLLRELHELLSAQSALTRRLLGDGSEPDGSEGEGGGHTHYEGSYQPLPVTMPAVSPPAGMPSRYSVEPPPAGD